jgi:pimeloyl-ACP methyl ester carboxylesterase
LSTVLSIVMLVAAGYAMVLLAAFAFQSRLVYFPNVPSRAIGPGPDSIGLAYESVEILTEDGVRLDAWYVPVREPRGTVLFFHGNAGNISHRLDSLRVFNGLGFATLIFDYRGYGRSEGAVSEQGIYRDAEAVWRHLTEERGIPATEVILFGRSLGAAVAAYMASQHRPGALIIERRSTLGSPRGGWRVSNFRPATISRLLPAPCSSFTAVMTKSSRSTRGRGSLRLPASPNSSLS